jgi:hypothetical protein
LTQNQLTLLLLLGDKSEHFLSSLESCVHLFSSFVIHDVAHSSYIDQVLGVLRPLPGGFAQRAWKSEVGNRQDLVNLLPQGKMGLIMDSLTNLCPSDELVQHHLQSDVYHVKYIENGKMLSKATLFRGGLGFQISPQDYTQVTTEEIKHYPSWDGLTMQREVDNN